MTGAYPGAPECSHVLSLTSAYPTSGLSSNVGHEGEYKVRHVPLLAHSLPRLDASFIATTTIENRKLADGGGL